VWEEASGADEWVIDCKVWYSFVRSTPESISASSATILLGGRGDESEGCRQLKLRQVKRREEKKITAKEERHTISLMLDK